MSSRSSLRRGALASAALATAGDPARILCRMGCARGSHPGGDVPSLAPSPSSCPQRVSPRARASIRRASRPPSVASTQSTTATPISGDAAAPVARTTMLVLDSSGSMAEFGKLETAKSAANQYLDGLPADVNAGLISFADKAEVKVAPTQDREAVRAAIASLKAEGSTALNDAVVLGVNELGDRRAAATWCCSPTGRTRAARPRRRAPGSNSPTSGVVLDAVSAGQGSQQKELAAFAKAGNGSLVTATDATALTAAFESAARSVTPSWP